MRLAKQAYNIANPPATSWANNASTVIVVKIKFNTQNRFKLKKVVAIQVEDI